jgi:colanic acid/amylovoran biosynthesis glycosyltransferase
MKLYYFTASYPFGLGELWKANELEILVKHFDEIVVIPYSHDGNFDSPKELPEGVKLLGPLFREASFSFKRWKGIKKILLSRFRQSFLKEFFTKRVYQSRSRFISWLTASLHVLRLMDHPVIKQIIGSLDKNTILYFFWGKGAGEFLPFIDTGRCFKTFVRMHRYDLFETVNNNYIPYRRPLLESIDVIAPSSEAGRAHLQELYPDFNYKIKLFRLGTIGNGKQSKSSTDGIFRVVSCSYLSIVKRVGLMVESLQYISFPILWRHVGDGNERREMDDLIRKYKLEDKFIIEGFIDTRELLDFYTSNSFDLFVNVSASEGVPMSIMESLSVSIPVMATGVGGNGELVDDSVGKILAPNPTARELASALSDYYHLPATMKEQKRQKAMARSREQCDAVQLAEELVKELKSNPS